MVLGLGMVSSHGVPPTGPRSGLISSRQWTNDDTNITISHKTSLGVMNCDNWFTHILIPSGAEARSFKWPWHSVCCMFKKLYINNLEQKSLSMKQIALLAGPASRRNRNISSFLHSSRWFPADGVFKLPSEKLKQSLRNGSRLNWMKYLKKLTALWDVQMLWSDKSHPIQHAHQKFLQRKSHFYRL